MDFTDAQRLMAAADENPVLAAWAAIFYQHGVVCITDSYPYEAWEAYQCFYNHDFVTAAEFNYNDERSFLRQTPSAGDIQDVIARFDETCDEHYYQEIQMPNNDSNPFADDNAIAPRRQEQGVARRQVAGATRRQELSNPFEEDRSIAPSRPRGGELAQNIFSSTDQQSPGLACHNDGNQSPVSTLGGETYQPDVRCGKCHKQVAMVEVQFLGSDGNGSLDSELVLALFEGVCVTCGFIHHQSVGRQADPGAFR